MFEQVCEKALGKILRIMNGVTATADEGVKRRPIYLAKLCQCGARRLRFGLRFPCRDDYAPVGRREDIAVTRPIACSDIQVTGLLQDWRR